MNGPPRITAPAAALPAGFTAATGAEDDSADAVMSRTIQPHGILLATDAQFAITHVSANAPSLTGVSAETLLGRPLAELLGREACAAILQVVDDASFGPHYPLAVTLPHGTCSAYVHRDPQGGINLELEPVIPAGFDAAAARAQAAFAKLRGIRNTALFYSRLLHDLRLLTGYDRTFLFRFNQQGDAEIIAEDHAPGLPASPRVLYQTAGILPAARALFLHQRIRVIPDAAYTPVPVLGAGALDLARFGLRGVLPSHLDYLRRMGAAASLAVSIAQEDTHWGMLVCHHHRPFLPSPGMRAICGLLGQLTGLLMGEMAAREQLAARFTAERRMARIAEQLDRAGSIGAGLAAASAAVLGLVNASGAYVRIGQETRFLGVTPAPDTAEAIMTALRQQNADFPARDHIDASDPVYAGLEGGVMLVPLTFDKPHSYPPGDRLAGAGLPGGGLLWFRAPRVPGAGRQQSATAQHWTEADRMAAQELQRVLTRALLRQTEAELIRMSITDPLTGLPNRRMLETRLAAWRGKPSRRPACLIFLDIDRFKSVNDSLGHFAGDELLQQVAGRLRTVAGEDLLLTRLGGDEFVMFAEGISRAAVPKLTSRVLGLFQTAFPVAGHAHHAFASAGVVWARDANRDMMRQADAAMHAAKRAGGNRAVMFQAELHRQVLDRMQIEQDLFNAIEQNQFVLYYQPVVKLVDRKVVAYESLIRWRHPTRGLVMPMSFISIAEEIGLIGRIGAWVAAEAIRQLAATRQPDLRLGFNVSARQLVNGGFAEDVGRLLAAHNIAGSRFAIEVTETTLMEDQAVRELQRLRDLGCRVAIDDFGTGYSSLSYLRRLPVDTIKIDRSFVERSEIDPGAEKFLRAIVNLASTLDLRIMAEGIENEAQFALVKKLGCENGQGYLFGRPEPAEHWGFNATSALADADAEPPAGNAA